MRLRELRHVGHLPSLVAGLLHFEVSFAVWVLLGALGPFLARDLGLSPAMRGTVVATPLLSAAVFRLVLGRLSDEHGPRRVGIVSMLLTMLPLAWGWLAADGVGQVLAVGVLLGIAGASFAVALPLAGSHYPASHRGLALGIAGAGNSGTIATGLLAPRIAERIGWQATLGVAMVPVALAAVAFALLAREAPGPRTRRSLRAALRPLAEADCWRLCGLYGVTFGGFVGLVSYLPTLAVDRYGLAPVAAGTLTAAAAGFGSFLRPAGGSLADRVGGTRVLAGVYIAAGAAALLLARMTSMGPATAVVAVALLGALGAGNGAVFQLVSARFPDRLGLVTGIVGAAGGAAGFLLPTVMGAMRQSLGSFGPGLAAFGLVALAAAPSVLSIRVLWARRRSTAELAEAKI